MCFLYEVKVFIFIPTSDVTKIMTPSCHTMSHYVDLLPLNLSRNLWMAPYMESTEEVCL